MTNINRGEIKIFKAEKGDIKINVKLEKNTVWLSLNQISEIFGRDKSVISRHIKNIFSEGELNEKQTVAKNATVQKEGLKTVTRNIEYFNLDLILSVGYRVNSKQATNFRIWVTSILKDHIIKGYSINEKRLREKGLDELEGSINLIKKALTSGDISKDEALGLLDIITNYSSSWLLLQKYDEDDLVDVGNTKKLIYELQSNEAFKSINELKKALVTKGEATDLFAQLSDVDGLKGIFGNIYQTFDGKELYTSSEEKAANLLYFIVKDHPFVDGNKRSGAFIFILFLAKNRLLLDNAGDKKINDRALVAITLLIAESNPKDKNLMIKLLINLIN